MKQHCDAMSQIMDTHIDLDLIYGKPNLHKPSLQVQSWTWRDASVTHRGEHRKDTSKIRARFLTTRMIRQIWLTYILRFDCPVKGRIENLVQGPLDTGFPPWWYPL